LTLGLSTAGSGYTDSSGNRIEIFRCPSCKEYVNTSMSKCRFCGAALDQAALANAKGEERIDRICGGASLILRYWWFMPALFWSFGIFDCNYFRIGFRLGSRFSGWQWLPGLSLAPILFLWVRIRGVSSARPLVFQAQRALKLALWLWVATFPLPLTVLFIARRDLLTRIYGLIRGNQPVSTTVLSLIVGVTIGLILNRRRLSQVLNAVRRTPG